MRFGAHFANADSALRTILHSGRTIAHAFINKRTKTLLVTFLSAIASPYIYSAELTIAAPKECSKFDRAIYKRIQCQECMRQSGTFVVPCADSKCLSFGDPRCEGNAESNSRACSEAKINIDWVIDRDPGAKQRYASFRSRGQSPVDAVISAQAHNPHAQDTIRQCRAWASKYLADLGQMQSGKNATSPNDVSQKVRARDIDISKCSALIEKKWGTNNLSVTVANHCDVPIKYSICFWYSDGWTIPARNATVPARNGGGIVAYAMHDVEGNPKEVAAYEGKICPDTHVDCPLETRKCF